MVVNQASKIVNDCQPSQSERKWLSTKSVTKLMVVNQASQIVNDYQPSQSES